MIAMRMLRLAQIFAATALALVLAPPVLAMAQSSYPERTIKIVVPTPPGSAPDLLTRLVAKKLAINWKQPVIVENRPGASGNIGAEAVARAEPDGYTLFATFSAPLATNRFIYSKLTFDPESFVPVTVLASAPNVLIVHKDLPVSSLQELIALARVNPEKYTYASGIGGTPHLGMELLKIAAGVDIRQIPYGRGAAPALTDLLAGRVDMMFPDLSDALPHITSGAVKALGVGSKTRSPDFPEIPAISETLPDFVSVAWFAIVAPPNTPPEIAAELSEAIAATLRLPDVAIRLRELGLTPVGSSPSDSGAFIRAEAERWQRVILSAGIKVE